MATTVGKNQPLRYRGYVYDEETGLYYLQSRYYNPEWGRFISSDSVINGNLFAYCGNNPLTFSDPNGKTDVCILGDFWNSDILLPNDAGGAGGIFVINLSAAVRSSVFSTPLAEGLWTGRFISLPYTASDDITDPQFVQNELQICADASNKVIQGNGHIAGTLKHAEFKKRVDALNNPYLMTEVSYYHSIIVDYGHHGSVRLDVVLYNAKEGSTPKMAWDFKTGNARLTEKRIQQIHIHFDESVPISELRGR